MGQGRDYLVLWCAGGAHRGDHKGAITWSSEGEVQHRLAVFSISFEIVSISLRL